MVAWLAEASGRSFTETYELVCKAVERVEARTATDRPDEMNHRPGQMAAVGGYGSVLWRLQSYVDAGVVLSASWIVSAIAGLAQLRVRRWSIAAQVLAAVTIPLTLLLAYFGVSTSDVSDETSIPDFGAYWVPYMITGILVLGSALLLVAL
jgi:hypothetical protein